MLMQERFDFIPRGFDLEGVVAKRLADP